MIMRDAIVAEYTTEYGHREFTNEQEPRLSGQGFGADPNKTSLTFTEFLDSYFGPQRLQQTAACFDSEWTFDDELMHIGNVLQDNVA